jgi:prepilin-type N-terminal cleavage/methylation domain-containing protein
MKRNQSGFTLIEIAIVLVIIGLLLGGVLKGQELINSAKVKNLANDFKNVPVFIYGYQDKFKALPGDDLNADTHVGGVKATTPASKQGNGVIDGAWDTTTQTDESWLFWQHIRLAGFGPGSTDTTDANGDYIPKNAFGGNLGVTNSTTDSPITAAPSAGPGIKGTYVVCSGSIPGKFAKQLDVTLDDGNTATGSVMVLDPATAQTSLAIGGVNDDTPYTVCMGY